MGGTVSVAAFIAEIDEPRTIPNQNKILDVMIDGVWRTYREIGDVVGLPPETIGSHLRNLRMEKGGGYVVCRRSRGDRTAGLYEYQVLPPGSKSEFDAAMDKRATGKGFLAGVKYAAKLVLKAGSLPDAKRALIRELEKAA